METYFYDWIYNGFEDWNFPFVTIPLKTCCTPIISSPIYSTLNTTTRIFTISWILVSEPDIQSLGGETP